MRGTALLVATLLLAGCALDDGCGSAAADCDVQVRFDDAVYTGTGATSGVPATALGRGDQSSCEDCGSDARGTYFADDPPQVQVWAIEGYPVEEVLAVGEEPTALQLYVAQELPADERARLLEELAP